jgi:hypothetical protein
MPGIPIKQSSTNNVYTVSLGPGGSGSSGASTISVSNPSNPVLMGGTVIGPSTWANATSDIKPGRIEVHGDAIFEGNITWKGRDMQEWFATVESRLGMLQPNPKLEQGWEELAQLRQQYVDLERKLLEQQRIFDILKQE